MLAATTSTTSLVSGLGRLADRHAGLAVSVSDGNDNAPVITSNGGGASASISARRERDAVTTVTATDADAGAVADLRDRRRGGRRPVRDRRQHRGADLCDGPGLTSRRPTLAATTSTTSGLGLGRLADRHAGLAVSVTDANDNAPVITSNGGGASASVNRAENGDRRDHGHRDRRRCRRSADLRDRGRSGRCPVRDQRQHRRADVRERPGLRVADRRGQQQRLRRPGLRLGRLADRHPEPGGECGQRQRQRSGHHRQRRRGDCQRLGGGEQHRSSHHHRDRRRCRCSAGLCDHGRGGRGPLCDQRQYRRADVRDRAGLRGAR